MAKTVLFILLWIKVVNNNCELLVLWLIEQHLITSLQMHLDGTHLPREVLARPLYQPLAEVGGKLRPASVEMFTLLPTDVPMLAAISLAALRSIEPGMNIPACPSVS